ncbi:MAG: glycosyl hydrolase family 9, partial [Tannerellaceae bacterium]|nr:glycosyl hydrolase family 9 [Tannerellaceae bacterium]
MKRTTGTILLLLLFCGLPKAQVDEKLRNDVRNTGFVHSPLPIDYAKSFETFGLTKKALQTNMLCDMEDMSRWSHRGIGGMEQTGEHSISGKHSLRLTAPVTAKEFPEWGLGLGTSMASFDVGGVNWEKYNRIMFYIYPDCEGARSIYLNLYVENDGKIKVPDKYGREGYHEINLINHQWNQCFVEMTELSRDKVSRIMFAIEIFGKEETMGDFFQYDIDAVELQTVENPEVVSGWQPAAGRIIHSTTGYRPESEKSAIIKASGHGGKFQLVDYTTNQVAFEGDI